MATFTVLFYEADPSGLLPSGVGRSFVWRGPDEYGGSATITDNERGIEGATLDDDSAGSESARADVTTSSGHSTGSSVDAELVWTVRDTVTGETFQIVEFDVESGSAAGDYTLSERPLVTGRTYEVLGYDSNPNAAAGDAAFTYSDFGNGVIDGTDGDDLIDLAYRDPQGDRVDGDPGDPSDSILAGDGDDTVYGAGGDDTVEGGAGDDLIHGGSGDDSLLGGSGDDTLEGGAGADTLSGGSGLDYASYAGSDSAVTVDLSTNSFSGGDAEGDVSHGGLDGLIGSDHDDILTGYDDEGTDADGTYWTNVILAGRGDDTVSGLGGDDSLYGEDGADSVDGGAGDDTVDGGAGNDILLGGTGADILLGGDGNDTIFAAHGDTVNAGSGDDLVRLVDLGEGGGTIFIEGQTTGQDGGDTLDFNNLVDRGTLDYTTSASGEMTGTAEMYDGTLVHFSNIDNIICFTPGTRILTARGYRPVETLRPGDLLVTRDAGLQPLRWTGSREVPAEGRFAPVRIGGGHRPLLVSPQHRMLIADYRAELLFGEREVFAAAAHLAEAGRAETVAGGTVTYIHLLLDAHHVIDAEGLATESFHPGLLGLSALSDESRASLFAARPGLRADLSAYGGTARRCLRRHEVQAFFAMQSVGRAWAA